MGLINAIYDVVAAVVALLASYYCSKGHFPRFMAFGICCFGLSFILNILPYAFYGAGHDALALTKEFGSEFHPNATQDFINEVKRKDLCFTNSNHQDINLFSSAIRIFFIVLVETLDDCNSDQHNEEYQGVTILLAFAQALAGFGGSIYSTLGPVYIDDNVKKSKAPILFCLSSFVGLMAPALGYSLSAYFLKYFVTPSLHPSRFKA